MIAGVGASVALSLRIADHATARAARAERAISTGQAVASVRDDGARWAIGRAASDEAVVWNVRRATLARVEAGLSATAAMVDVARGSLERMRDVAMKAMSLVPEGDGRLTFESEWTGAIEDGLSLAGRRNPAIDAAGKLAAGYRLDGADSFYGSGVWRMSPDGAQLAGLFSGANAKVPNPFLAVEIIKLGQTDLAVRVSEIEDLLETTREWSQGVGADLAQAERLRTAVERGEALSARNASRLLDADLGRAATDQAQARTRATLALDMTRRALDAYGAKATGLLSNVQRTQAAILA